MHIYTLAEQAALVNSTPDALQSDQQALLAAMSAVFEPLAQLCIARGLTFQSAEELLKLAYIKAARRACAAELAKPTRLTSRLSTITGLTRREVARLDSKAAEPQLPATRSHITELLTRWASSPDFVDARGAPAALVRTGPSPSFEALAASVTRDVHPRSLLAELERLNLVAVTTGAEPSCELVVLLTDAFVPRADWSQMIGFLGANVGDHLRAAVENVLGSGSQHFEQVLTADELSSHSLSQVRQLISNQWRQLLTTLGPELERLMQEDRVAGRAQDQLVRIGLYSWMQPMPAPPSGSTPPMENPPAVTEDVRSE